MAKESDPIGPNTSEAASGILEETFSEPRGLLDRAKRSWLLLSVAFGVGLLLGWLVLGWLVLPVKWINTDPWDLRPEHQERYLSLVAEDYWRTGDLRRVLADLEGWEETSLARRLASMEAREQDPERRQHIAALIEALGLPEAARPFWAALLAQKTILFSIILSALPMVGAVMLVFSSLVKRESTKEMSEESEAEEETELSSEELQQLSLLAEAEPDSAQSEGQEAEEEEKAEETENAEEEEKAEETENAEDMEQQGDVSDLLSGLFDDEDEHFECLQILSKGLEDVDVDSLLQNAREVLSGLIQVCALRRQVA